VGVWRLAMRLVMKTKVAKANARPRMTQATTADARRRGAAWASPGRTWSPGAASRTGRRRGCTVASPPRSSRECPSSKPSGLWLPALRFAAFARTGDADGICCATSCAMLETLGDEDLEPDISTPSAPAPGTLQLRRGGTPVSGKASADGLPQQVPQFVYVASRARSCFQRVGPSQLGPASSAPSSVAPTCAAHAQLTLYPAYAVHGLRLK